MSPILRRMIDFAELKTPARHGDVLVTPPASKWLAAARENHARLSEITGAREGLDLASWRRTARKAIFGKDDALVFALGHQPEFIHPGVWAKHVAAVRAAQAGDGIALNLVVDTDAPRTTSLAIPAVNGDRVELRRIALDRHTPGATYEQISSPSPSELHASADLIRDAMGCSYNASQMPAYLDALCSSSQDSDWVDRLIDARRSVELRFGVELRDVRVSDVWMSPLLIDMIRHCRDFANSYNNALASYRRTYRVRGSQRPIPDLHEADGRMELPVWAVKGTEPRSRLFVETAKASVRLFADELLVAEISFRELDSEDAVRVLASQVRPWRLRPRALALTMWARLLVADLFIHGIGGAKYDRISDSIIEDYYGVEPPHMACVSATLHLDVAGRQVAPMFFNELRHALRDLRFNPQRNLAEDKNLTPLFHERADAVQKAVRLRETQPANRTERRATFALIREINERILSKRPEAVTERENRLNRAIESQSENEILAGREYFFAMFDRPRLQTLLDALPSVSAFR